MEAEDRRFEELTDEKKTLVLKLREAVSSDADENSELLDNAMCRRYLAGSLLPVLEKNSLKLRPCNGCSYHAALP